MFVAILLTVRQQNIYLLDIDFIVIAKNEVLLVSQAKTLRFTGRDMLHREMFDLPLFCAEIGLYTN